jgi:ParB family transcriptional regulator, chromosome partitioning protein
MLDALKDLRKSLPKDEDKLWDWLLKQDQKTLFEILAVCVAATVDTIDRKRGSFDGDYSEDHVRQLSEALKLDMTEYWEPTAESYFDRVSSAQIIAAVSEGGSKADATEIRSKHGAVKKSELAKIAEKLLKGKGWLPALLRTAA